MVTSKDKKMKDKIIKNVPASVLERLLMYSKKEKLSYQQVLQNYLMERFLYRVSQSKYQEKFILKGALLLKVWQGQISRPTKDIDLLGKVENSLDNLARVIKECLSIEIKDGISFHLDSIKTKEIVKDGRYQGVRISVMANIGSAELSLQVDCGFGDVIVPKANWIEYPELLNYGQPKLLGYSVESVLAEKFHAMVDLDLANSRIKDFYDIWLLSRNNRFSGEGLSKAIKATFANRSTKIPTEIPTAFTEDFWGNENKIKQWKAFLQRTKLNVGELSFEEIVKEIGQFLLPLMEVLGKGQEFNLNWEPSKGWE